MLATVAAKSAWQSSNKAAKQLHVLQKGTQLRTPEERMARGDLLFAAHLRLSSNQPKLPHRLLQTP
jgi:hypothetical protein